MSAEPRGEHDGGGPARAGGPPAVVRPLPQRMPEAAETSAAVLTGAGFPKMPARVLMALVTAEQGSLTAADLADVLGVSPAAVSGAVRYLQTVGMVHRISQPGSRRDRYALPDDAWYVATLRKNPLYEQLAGLSESIAGELPEGSPARGRVEEMAHFYRFLMARMPQLLDEWERERNG